MKVLFSVIALSFSLSQAAQAASYKTSFVMNNPGVRCENENMSRFTGREVSLAVDDLGKVIPSAKTADGTTIQTEVRDVVTVEQGKRCETMNQVPNILKGTREIYISQMADDGKCNAYVVEELTVSLGKNNPVLFGKTVYPIIAGTDFSAWSKEICKYTETDFKNAIKRIVSGK